MSINKLVSINNVLLDLLDDLGLDHTKYTPMFARWIEKAEKKIGSRYQYQKKKAILNIKGCVAELPCDAMSLQLAILGNQGCDCSDLFNKFQCGTFVPSSPSSEVISGYNNLSFLIVDIVNNGQAMTANNFKLYEVADNKIIFRNNYDGYQVTVQYLGLVTDCDGIIMVGENHVDALGWYCKWMFSQRSIRSGIDIGRTRDLQMEWERQCVNARAIDAQLTESERQRVVEKLHDAHAGWGLPLTPTMGTWADQPMIG
jgi:hypothetical protein